MDWAALIRESLWMSIAFSGMLTVLVMGSLFWNREIWLNDYPPDVKAKWGPISETARKQRTVFTAIFFTVIIGWLIYVPFRLSDALGSAPNFLTVFISIALIFLIFNLWDAFIIDWFLLMFLFRKQMILPGTEGMAGYDDMSLWTANLLKGFPISLVMGLIGAAVTSLVIWIGTMI